MEATVRSPGARIAPITSTLAHSHTRSLKTASNWRNTGIILFGRVSIFSFSFGRILREAYSVFPFLSSDWIKSTSVHPFIYLNLVQSSGKVLTQERDLPKKG